MVGRPPEVYKVALRLLTAVYDGKFTAEDLLAELIRWLVIVREEKRQGLALLLQGVHNTAYGSIPLSTEEIINLVEQHMRSPYSSPSTSVAGRGGLRGRWRASGRTRVASRESQCGGQTNQVSRRRRGYYNRRR